MPLDKCNNCGEEVSDKARFCPNCGSPIEHGGAPLQGAKEKEELGTQQTDGADEGFNPNEDFSPDEGVNPNGEFSPNEGVNPNGEFSPNEGVNPNGEFSPYEGVNPDEGFGPNYDKKSKDEMAPKKNNRGLKILVPSIAAGIVVVIAAFLVIGLFARKKPGALEAVAPKVFVDQKGYAYMNKSGTMIKIKGDFQEGESSVDQKHIALLDKDGVLYSYDVKGADKTKVAKDVQEIAAARDKGIIFIQKKALTANDILKAIVDDYDGVTSLAKVKEAFEDDYYINDDVEDAKRMYRDVIGKRYQGEDEEPEEKVYRYMYASKDAQKVGEGKCIVAANTLSLLYTDYKNIYTLPEDAKEKIKAAVYTKDKEIGLYGVSNNGKLAVWREGGDDSKTVYLAENGKKEKLAKLGKKALEMDATVALFINKDTEVLVFNLGDDTIYRKKIGKETVKMNVGGRISGSIFTKDYSLYSEKGSISDLYVQTFSDDDYQVNLYCLNPDGDREKVLSDIKAVQAVGGGKLFYLNKDEELYSADLGNKGVKHKKKISSDTKYASVSKDGSVVYFGKDYDKDTKQSTLYASKAKGNSKPVKIDTDIRQAYLTADGKGIAYIKDVTEENDTQFYGELYTGKLGKKSKKVSSDVMGLYSDNIYNSIDIKDFNFFKYTSDDDDGEVYGDYVHYDGRTTDSLVKNVHYE